MNRKIILHINPETWVRVTQKDKIFFRIPRGELRPDGLKRLLRLEKYNEYKANLSEQAKLNHFEYPEQGLCISFFVPMPKTWRKWKRKLMHFKLHQSRPDLSNYLKSFEDSLCKEDSFIGHYGELGKYWVDFPTGWIELTVTEKRIATLKLPESKKEYSKL